MRPSQHLRVMRRESRAEERRGEERRDEVYYGQGWRACSVRPSQHLRVMRRA